MQDTIDRLCNDVRDDVIACRRHLHAHPELSFQEHETAQFIVDHLAALDGIEISRPSGTSVVGRLQGGAPGPTIAIRADFDALPNPRRDGSAIRFHQAGGHARVWT